STGGPGDPGAGREAVGTSAVQKSQQLRPPRRQFLRPRRHFLLFVPPPLPPLSCACMIKLPQGAKDPLPPVMVACSDSSRSISTRLLNRFIIAASRRCISSLSSCGSPPHARPPPPATTRATSTAAPMTSHGRHGRSAIRRPQSRQRSAVHRIPTIG